MAFEEYIEKGGRKLRLGYTTGSCAAAAAKAAAFMLGTGRRVSQVRIRTPKGPVLVLEIEDVRFFRGEEEIRSGETEPRDIQSEEVRPGEIRSEEARPGEIPSGENDPELLRLETIDPAFLTAVSCAVRKDSGDDPDITNQAMVYARVSRSSLPGIRIDGGEGVGRVTKPGLDQPVGSAAINSTPRRMIREAVEEALQAGDIDSEAVAVTMEAVVADSEAVAADSKAVAAAAKADGAGPGKAETDTSAEKHTDPAADAARGLDVIISVPQGRALAEKTFNPKLGIVGGISILGTSGIVEPMSDQALLDTIRTEIRVRAAEKWPILPAAPGNYGKKFFLDTYGFSIDTAVTASNFIYDTVKMAEEAGFGQMLFVGHIGKLVKVAGGVCNTHSQYGDRRMEILGTITEEILRAGGEEAASAAPDLIRELDGCVSTDEAVRILQSHALAEPVLAEMTRRIQAVMQGWTAGRMQVEIIVFSNVFGELGRTPQAAAFLQVLRGIQEKGRGCSEAPSSSVFLPV